jgi:blue copper oxidase
MNRRNFLQSSTLFGSGLILPSTLWSQSSLQDTNPLQVPPLLTGERDGDRRRYRLDVQAGATEFFTGTNTPTLGINGGYLGPTLRLRRGDNVTLSVSNNLQEPTTLHWHGLHVPASADGGPHQIVQPGQVWDAEFLVDQQAGTFWYHSHLLGRTGEQVYKGLAGMLQIEDDVSNELEIPSEYGVDDIPVILQDRNFNADGSLRYTSSRMDSMLGLFGNTMMVNGTINPRFEPRSQLVRFRFLNASNARTYNLAFSDDREMQQLACDGGFLEHITPMRRIELAPGERCEVLADFSDGQPVDLISVPMAVDSPFRTTGMMGNMHTMNQVRLQIMTIIPNSNLQRSSQPARELATLPTLDPDSADRMRQFTLSMMMGMGMMGRGRGPAGGGMGSGMNSPFAINGQGMDMAVINERVPVGSTEIWEISNDSMMMHPFHIHHGQFRIVSSNGRPWPEHEQAYKDTVKVGPGQSVRVLMKFDDFADAELPYMYHCHILEHEDAGMMGQFVVE